MITKNPTDKLNDHFKTLHSELDPNALSAFQINMLDDKKHLEDSNHLQSELDNPIWIEEIDKVIKKLKNKKTARIDGIRNEMVKTSSRFIRYPVEKLYNLILQSGIFPTSWSNGIITALHKSGNKNDPSNYRGICISSWKKKCLGSDFVEILTLFQTKKCHLCPFSLPRSGIHLNIGLHYLSLFTGHRKR